MKMGRMLRSFGGKESRWGACFDLSAERNQDGAHASIFRRKGIKMGRMLRPFSGKESRWGACFDLSHLRKSELHLAADYADLPDFNPLNPRNPRLNSRFKSEKIAALMAERVVHEVLETKPTIRSPALLPHWFPTILKNISSLPRRVSVHTTMSLSVIAATPMRSPRLAV